MKLYSDAAGNAPSPRRVRMFLAEKGVEIPVEKLDINVEPRETKAAAFLEKNPFGNVPVLELDDGTCIAESMAIIRYVEEVDPRPDLLGATRRERAEIEGWLRRVEQRLYIPIDIAPLLGQIADAAVAATRAVANDFLGQLDGRLASREFIACDRFSMADIFAFGALDFGRHHAGFPLPEERAHVMRWFEAIERRPSSAA